MDASMELETTGYNKTTHPDIPRCFFSCTQIDTDVEEQESPSRNQTPQTAGKITLYAFCENLGMLTVVMKPTSKLSMLMDAFCDKYEQGWERGQPRTFRFLFDGNRITDTDTPSKLDMADKDQIDVMMEQYGG
ncbi:hypothetical protein BC936DRAFT_148848 [Jimgerdemannia flammicorona]|uniref:Ubiquitin-like domain-containing protein n=1 Tax=Jimgerdemannia flammicorona TaxID=994334 RepID=A0A433D264_9FUNG|nr:hypothetical protein BC936DRAFT_148848 [Jimgerdemannia flammicorona]